MACKSEGIRADGAIARHGAGIAVDVAPRLTTEPHLSRSD
jgi:hypothetical protein